MFSELISIRAGNTQAFGAIYDITYTKVYKFVYHRVNDTQKTEDIVSEVYMKALKRISSFRGTTEWEVFAWLYRIAYTTIIDTQRTQKDAQSLDDLAYEPWYTPSIQWDAANDSKLSEVMNYIQTLSERERNILTMRIWDGLSYAEISEITGESISSAKKIVSRTLAKIAANITYIFIFSLLAVLQL